MVKPSGITPKASTTVSLVDTFPSEVVMAPVQLSSIVGSVQFADIVDNEAGSFHVINPIGMWNKTSRNAVYEQDQF